MKKWNRVSVLRLYIKCENVISHSQTSNKSTRLWIEITTKSAKKLKAALNTKKVRNYYVHL